MTRVAAFHSLKECQKKVPRYHTDDACPQALAISRKDLREGSGGYYQCELCATMHQQPAAANHRQPNAQMPSPVVPVS
jgi:hypothetical protein